MSEEQVSKLAVDEWMWNGGATTMPRRADVVIIGGGIVGCSAAYFLTQRGVSVALFEKGRIAGEQSGRNWGWVRQQGRSPVELPLMMQSLGIWQELTRVLHDSLGFTQGGSLYLAEDREQLESFARWVEVAREFGLDTRLLADRELTSILQSSSGRWLGALYTGSDSRAEPNRAAPAIARAAHNSGANIISNCAVRGIERSAGRLHSVVTEHGTVQTSIAVCAAGAWTSLFCRSIDITVPQLLVKGTVARTAFAPHILEGEAWSRKVAIRRRRDGGYTVAHGSALEHALVPATLRFARKFLPAMRQEHGAVRLRIGRDFFTALATPRRWDLGKPSPFERERVLDPPPDLRILGEIRSALALSFPEIAAVAFLESWAGMIESSPDVLPIISPVKELEGFFVVTGFSGHGFGIGPGAGRLVADMVTGTATAESLVPFRLSRYFDGSPIRPGPTI
jgi:glycine/D-amino acid oxidase-like deaminating enzyme